MIKKIALLLFLALPILAFPRGYTENGFIGHDNMEDLECVAQSTSATFVDCATIPLPDNSGFKVICECNGIRSDNAEFASIDKCALFKRETGTASRVGTLLTTFDQPGTSGWDIDIDVNSNDVRCRVKSPSETVNWSCRLRMVKKL